LLLDFSSLNSIGSVQLVSAHDLSSAAAPRFRLLSRHRTPTILLLPVPVVGADDVTSGAYRRRMRIAAKRLRSTTKMRA